MSSVALAYDLVGEIAARRGITADDVRALRREVFAGGIVSRADAQAIFDLDTTCHVKDLAWADLYVDTLTDYFVWQSEPSGFIDTAKTGLLMENIVREGRVAHAAALELLINVIFWAESCPEDLVVLVLEAVLESVLGPGRAAYGAGRRPGRIDAVDVEVIRKVLNAGASCGGLSISRRKADLLFDLNRASVERENDPGWRELFVRSLATHLMFPQGLPVEPAEPQGSRREAWLRERRGIGLLLMDVGRAFGGFDFAAVWKEVAPRQGGDEGTTKDGDTRGARPGGAIAQAEAQWLIARLGGIDSISENERALLSYIRQEAPALDPILGEALIKAAG